VEHDNEEYLLQKKKQLLEKKIVLQAIFSCSRADKSLSWGKYFHTLNLLI